MKSTSETNEKKRTSKAKAWLIVFGLNMLALLVIAGSSSASTFTDIPTEVGDALGVSAETAALMLSACILASLGMVLALLSKKFNMLTMAVPLVAVMAFLVTIAWLPYWVLLVIGLIIAIQFSGKLKEVLT